MSAEVVHRVGVVVGIVLLLGWLAGWGAQARRERRLRRRTARLLPREPVAAGARRVGARDVRRWLPLLGVAAGGWVLVGGITGLVIGTVAAAGLWWWRARRRDTVTGEPYGAGSPRDAGEALRQLPLAADLLAACIAAGAGPVVAAQAVGEALDGPVGRALARGAAEARLGGPPGEAWRRLASMPGAGPLARLLARADESGLPAAVPVARLAAEARADRGRAVTARARRAAVMVTAPVGLCFLPAFVAVGVLPVVIGLAGGVLGGGDG
ncbi:type II secretion system F family protein [Streptomyces sp. NPDC090106]|uniref:type II secretion system F family protein n=1 Tax=Streptomyces sp. NPDC090106 TaxID=3365946 RepID=UPI003828B199